MIDYDKHRIIDLALQRNRIKKMNISNVAMDSYISLLKNFKEIPCILPYDTKGTTFIALFPQDEKSKDHAKYERCDALIYDVDYEVYFKVQSMAIVRIQDYIGVISSMGLNEGACVVRVNSCTVEFVRLTDYALSLIEYGKRFDREISDEILDKWITDNQIN